MANPAVTYTFANSTVADATQVNQNFTDLINGMTDGTKDFSISALTCAGTATLNGNVNLGNASGDDLTITASLASTISIKTTNSYDIGSATLGLRSIYFGSSGGAFSTRVIGGAAASSYTLTLPTTGGTIGQFPVTNGSGTLTFRYPEKTTAKTTTYTGTGDESTIVCDASGAAFTVTLPAAASFTGKHYYIIKTDTSLNAVTIDGNASETINGATTTTINTQYECIKIVCDGSNWHILERTYPMDFVAYTPTIVGAGTVSNVKIYSRRVGDCLHARGTFQCGTVAASTASISLGFQGTDGNVTTAGTGKIGSTLGLVGIAAFNGTGAAVEHVIAVNGATVVNISNTSATSTGLAAALGNACWSTNQVESVDFMVPIVGWNG
jgi:hypothetical protein